MGTFSKEDLEYLDCMREYTKKELSDEEVLADLEETIYADAEVGLTKFDKENEKVFVKSLYRW